MVASHTARHTALASTPSASALSTVRPPSSASTWSAAYERAYVAPKRASIRFQNSLSRTRSTVRRVRQGNLGGMSVDVVHRPEQSRFEAEGGAAFLTYEVSDGVVAFLHTVVPPEHGGKGVAGALATEAVGWARGQGLNIDARCSYVRGWLEKNS